MTMEWKNTNYRFDPNGWNGKRAFENHDEQMVEFRRSHADIALVNGPRLDESALLEILKPLRIRHAMGETGGSRFCHSATDWPALVPLFKVARYKFSQN